MPELPEVETIVRDLSPRLVGRRLRGPRLLQADVLAHSTPRQLLHGLAGARIDDLFRRGKHAVFALDTGCRLVVQPGMTGSLVVSHQPLGPAERRHVVFTAGVGRGETLVYRDVRRLGTILLLDEPAWHSYTARIGPEPLGPGFRVEHFAELLAASNQAVKKVLMDQHRLAGVGNIYANEALYRARIDPSLPARRVDPAATGRLYRAVRDILRRAIVAQGATIRDYRTGTGGRGSFQFSLQVYGRGGKPCRRCGTRLAATHAIDARTTTFCWRCQAVSR